MSKKSWIVRMKRTVVTEFVVTGGSEDQVRDDPFNFDVGEDTEIEQTDYEVLSVEPNE